MSSALRYINRKNAMPAFALLLLLAMQAVLFMHAPAHLKEMAGLSHGAVHQASTGAAGHDGDDHDGDGDGDHSLCGVCFVGKILGSAWLSLSFILAAVLSPAVFNGGLSRRLHDAGRSFAFRSRAPPLAA